MVCLTKLLILTVEKTNKMVERPYLEKTPTEIGLEEPKAEVLDENRNKSTKFIRLWQAGTKSELLNRESPLEINNCECSSIDMPIAFCYRFYVFGALAK